MAIDRAQQAPSNWKTAFFTIWTGQAFSLVGSRIAMFALIWWVTDTTGSATVLALATLFAMLPQIVLGPVAGALVDRWNRRIVMIVADGGIALVSLWLAFLFWSGQIQVWHVYVIMIVRELGGIFHWPAMQASTSLMVPKEHLARVSGVNQAMYGALNIVGPALGALLLSLTAIHNIMLLDVLTALLATLPLLFVRVPQPEKAPTGGAAASSLWAEIKDGARYLFAWRGLMILLGLALVIKVALTPAFSLLPILATQHFGGDAGALAGMESAFGIGLVLGGLLLGVWGGFKRRIMTVVLGITVMGVSMMVLGLLSPSAFSVGIGALFVLGMSAALVDGPLFAILQGTIAPEMQGRVFMLFGSLVTLSSPVGLAIAGPVTDAVGVQVWYIVAGVLSIASIVIGLTSPALRRLEDYRQAPVGDEPDGAPRVADSQSMTAHAISAD
jgi:DHA3 family macrolide efflux protein-like MFS transporter